MGLPYGPPGPRLASSGVGSGRGRAGGCRALTAAPTLSSDLALLLLPDTPHRPRAAPSADGRAALELHVQQRETVTGERPGGELGGQGADWWKAAGVPPQPRGDRDTSET